MKDERMPWEKVLNAEQMRALDRRTIDDFGVSGAELMERAGRRLYDSVAGRWEEIAALEAVVVCGKGNNGGDGYVVARLLRQAGADVRVAKARPLAADAIWWKRRNGVIRPYRRRRSQRRCPCEY